MAPTILTDLAPELLIQILKSADNFADVTSLSSTSRKIFIIWKTNVDAICEAVLPRIVDCFEQALELLAAQKKVEGGKHAFYGHMTAVDRAEWILKWADTAAKALVYFEEDLIGNAHKGRLFCMTPSNRVDFLRAYYRAATLATLAKGPLPCEVLSSWDMLAFRQMKVVMRWLMAYAPPSERLEFGMEYDSNVVTHHTPRAEIPGENWPLIWDKANALHYDIRSLHCQSDDHSDFFAPFYSLLVNNFSQKSTNSERGARLSDLLPLIRERGHHCNKMYELSNP